MINARTGKTVEQFPKPFIRWAGSKKKLLSALLAHVPQKYRIYIEPFAGSACLYFALRPKRALLSDINGELIDTYQQVKNRVDEVIAQMKGLTVSREEYYRIRNTDSQSLPPAERAAKFIYLNRYCFNGLYRTNQEGVFNVPYGGWRTGKLPEPDLLRACSRLLQSADIRSCGFQASIEKAREGDFVYIDPPYSTKAGRIFREYHPDCFGEKELVCLRTALENLDRAKIRFLLSYTDSPEGRYLGKGFKRKYIEVRRQIAGFLAGRQIAHEMLIYNE